MLDKKLLKNLDLGLIIVVLIIFLIGILIISSATQSINLLNDDNIKYDLKKIDIKRQVKIQIVAFFIGIALVSLILAVDYNDFGDFYKLIYVLSILFLLLVYIPGLGVIRGGARSWIHLGPIDIQTSEFAKIGYILSFGKYLESKYRKLDTIYDLIGPIIFAAPFILLLLKQPDLGSALVFIIITFGMLFVAGINMKIVFWSGAGGVLSLPIVYRFLEKHQKERIDAFLHPNNPNLPGNYHVMQSKITIGSGKILGRGLFKGKYHRFDYLPVQETDFIFAVLGEELGFIGGLFLMLLYFAFLYKMVNISKNAKDVYGSLIVTGITFMFAFQIFENIGMTMGIMPVTGVTLPFMSYGGSSLITSILALGIVLNVGMRKQKIRF
ncbi:rod shape-determining protein RodA [Caminicella sporogenes]|uniref:rod shape-determining protein RodA n=1 Tax=Caminicella sporogenes TaxID=166485 RepID=UPI00254015CD|nr:rod shape-determining protein RodA [Caminicella sporogenes]WIF94426.1 rod shape-determining protein RodA [Caminicella sporogenes]